MINCQVIFTDDAGWPLAHLNSFISLTATKDLENWGDLNLTLPRHYVPDTLLKRDRMIQLWITAPGVPKTMWAVYFLLGWNPFSAQGSNRILLYGKGPKDLVRRRIVAEYKGTANTLRTTYADDLIKDIASAAFTDGISPAPDFGTRVLDGLTIQDDLSAGPIITKDFGWEALLQSTGGGILGDICNEAAKEGTPVWYDIVPTVSGTSVTFELRTYTTATFHDATEHVIFDPRRGTLKDGFWDEDYSNEINVAYVGGKGKGVLRETEQVGIADRYKASLWARSEGFVDVPDASASALEGLGNDALHAQGPITRIGGTPISRPSLRYVRDWEVGSRVTCRYDTREETPVVVGTALTIQNKAQQLEVRLDYGI